MKDPDVELNSDPAPSEFYKATPERKPWNNPTREQMVDSLNKAHDVNRKMAKELGDLRTAFEVGKKKLLWANAQKLALGSVLGGAAFEGFKVAALAIMKHFTR
jgi:heme oxygenase